MNDNEYSYMNNEIALVGAVFNTLIPKPLYKPKTPSFLVWLQIYAELYTVFHGPQNTFDTFSSKYPKGTLYL